MLRQKTALIGFIQDLQILHKGECMLRRIWRGEISLGWAFWGVGLGGLFPLFAVLFGIVGALAIGGMVGSIKAVPLPIRFFGLACGLCQFRKVRG